LTDLEIREHHRVADRHSRQEVDVALRAEEVNSVRQILGVFDQLARTPCGALRLLWENQQTNSFASFTQIAVAIANERAYILT